MYTAAGWTLRARLVSGRIPEAELRLDATKIYAHGITLNNPSYTRVQGPGCYAYQVDGDGFSYTIVFRAVLVP